MLVSPFASGPFSEATSCRGHVRVRSAAADHEGQVLKALGADIASYGWARSAVPPLGNSSALTRFTGESASKSTELTPFQLSSPECRANVEERSPISLLSNVAQCSKCDRSRALCLEGYVCHGRGRP